MKTKIILLIIIYLVSWYNAHLFSQDCKLYEDIELKTDYTDRIYEVIYNGMGKCPLSNIILELGYVPNTSLSIALGNCDYYLPIVNNPKYISFLNTVNYGEMIKIRLRFYRNKKNRLMQPIVVIKEILNSM
jgi:hypothetical protein